MRTSSWNQPHFLLSQPGEKYIQKLVPAIKIFVTLSTRRWPIGQATITFHNHAPFRKYYPFLLFIAASATCRS
ncbi:hypothetical protein PCANC_09380 [Puccinia coronata f. sp. avenae]|uniref:Uncharacterized protein n=1 Tax=Puccinia coronata f. sp. avenae TaxID=200324 RepID=A0A2N5VDB3_9BASI|nr:hypothetical protein PCANC_09380 [Puccinia coronata f. sp. avenae]